MNGRVVGGSVVASALTPRDYATCLPVLQRPLEGLPVVDTVHAQQVFCADQQFAFTKI